MCADSNYDVSILVLGAGELGMAVLTHLAKRITMERSRTKLSVLLRPQTIASHDNAKQRDVAIIRSLGIDILAGDIADSTLTQLSDIFTAFDSVISCTGFVGGSGTQLKLAHAAIKAGVRRYFPWQFGVDYDVIGKGSAQDLFDEQLDVRALLRGQRSTDWMIISTGMFTSFLFEPTFGVVDLAANTVRALGHWDNAVTVTTAEDIGLLTAEVVFADPAIRNQVVYTAGDTITYNELANLIDTTLSRKVHRVEWTVKELTKELADEPQNSLKKYRVVFAQGKGVSWEKSKTFNAQKNIQTVDVKQWMNENLL